MHYILGTLIAVALLLAASALDHCAFTLPERWWGFAVWISGFACLVLAIWVLIFTFVEPTP